MESTTKKGVSIQQHAADIMEQHSVVDDDE